MKEQLPDMVAHPPADVNPPPPGGLGDTAAAVLVLVREVADLRVAVACGLERLVEAVERMPSAELVGDIAHQLETIADRTPPTRAVVPPPPDRSGE